LTKGVKVNEDQMFRGQSFCCFADETQLFRKKDN